MLLNFTKKFTLTTGCFSLALACSDNKELKNQRKIIIDAPIPVVTPVLAGEKKPTSGDSTVVQDSLEVFKFVVNESPYIQKVPGQPDTHFLPGTVVGHYRDSGLILEADEFVLFDPKTKTELAKAAKPNYTYLERDQIFKLFPYRESIEDNFEAWGLVDMNSTAPSLTNPQIVKLIKSDSYATMVSPIAMQLESAADVVPLLVNSNTFWFQVKNQLILMNIANSTVRKTIVPIAKLDQFKVLSVNLNGSILVKDEAKYILYVYDREKTAVRSYTITDMPVIETLKGVYAVEEGILFLGKPNGYIYTLADSKWLPFSSEVIGGLEPFKKAGVYYYYPENRSLNNFEGSHTKISLPEFKAGQRPLSTASVAISPVLSTVLLTSCRGCHASSVDSKTYINSGDFNPLNLDHIKYLIQQKGKPYSRSLFEEMCTLSQSSVCRLNTQGAQLITDLINSL